MWMIPWYSLIFVSRRDTDFEEIWIISSKSLFDLLQNSKYKNLFRIKKMIKLISCEIKLRLLSTNWLIFCLNFFKKASSPDFHRLENCLTLGIFSKLFLLSKQCQQLGKFFHHIPMHQNAHLPKADKVFEKQQATRTLSNRSLIPFHSPTWPLIGPRR